ncbi:MAG TPA: response regulator [Anaerolineaceae bacterium]|nr:response regulator [Anaerolineaceae bacterium]HOS53315.1 response regulator [Anaerolineaceae bacterium]HPD62941.1 response regulator [Anaerolineaceae bacterium]HQF68662.1 response regulator [Anaerolineaceae bacterium]HRS74172.1 response regulator [Anaerolineaceae bacterium]
MPEKILIVDDDMETLRLVGMMLQRQGYEIAAANTGELALETAVKVKPSLIILDVVMPGMDGYQIARELRKNPLCTHIPILMFTAKNQMGDKIAGYGAGADDYLTKPVHPAELNAHVKALLDRMKKIKNTPEESGSGCIIGVLGCKGGLGVSTLVLNLAVSLSGMTSKEVVAVELKPGQGSWGVELDIANSYGLEKLLALPVDEITAAAVEKLAVHTSFNVRLLMASEKSQKISLPDLPEKTLAIIKSLNSSIPVLVLDIGNPYLAGFSKVHKLCDQLIVLTDAFPATVLRTRKLLGTLQFEVPKKNRYIDTVFYNHIRSEAGLTAEQITKLLPGTTIKFMIPPVPEQVFQANQKYIPLYHIQPEGLFSQQVNELSRAICQRFQL